MARLRCTRTGSKRRVHQAEQRKSLLLGIQGHAHTATAIDYDPRGRPTDHAFFRTVPALDDNERVLRYQRAFVDELLSYSLRYPHVLYCMNDETGEHVEWGDYWARHAL